MKLRDEDNMVQQTPALHFKATRRERAQILLFHIAVRSFSELETMEQKIRINLASRQSSLGQTRWSMELKAKAVSTEMEGRGGERCRRLYVHLLLLPTMTM